MSIIRVANVHLETTGTNRIDYSSGFTRLISGGTGGIVINTGDADKINVSANIAVTGNLILNNKNVDFLLTFANTAAGAAYNQANAANVLAATALTAAGAAYNKANAANVLAATALPNTSGVTFAGNMTITGNLTALSYNTSSDERLKLIINTAPFGLEQLNPKQYEMYTEPGRVRYGFVAQEVQNVFPNLVSTDNNGMLTLNYIDIIAIIVQEYKQIKKRIDYIEQQATNNQSKNNDINILNNGTIEE
jgi:hypothetical protein